MHFFSKLHAFCSLRVSQKLHAFQAAVAHATQWVKLQPSNKRPRLGYASLQQLKMAA